MVICGSYSMSNLTDGIKVSCEKCGDDLWLSNSSIDAVKERIKDVKKEDITTLCLVCGMEHAKKVGAKLQGPSKEQMEEVINAISKGPLKRNSNSDDDFNERNREL